MFLSIITFVVLFSMGLIMIRALTGSTNYDRILATNAFGSKIMIIIALLAALFNEDMLIDVALVYGMINFITTIGILKYVKFKDLGKE